MRDTDPLVGDRATADAMAAPEACSLERWSTFPVRSTRCGLPAALPDVAVIDDRGSLLISERISDDVAGFDRLVELIL